MDKTLSSAEILAAAVSRLERIIPKGSKPKLPQSTLRTVKKNIKSPTLRTLDLVSDALGTPAWLLIHPEGKEWDQNRIWLERIVRAYLHTTDEGRTSIQQAAIMAELVAVKTTRGKVSA